MDIKNLKVADAMVRDVVAVKLGTTIADVCRVLAQHGISGVPVLDEEGRLCGIVSEKDIISHQVLREHRLLPEAELFDLLTMRLPDPEERELAGQFVVVDEIMSRDVVSTTPETPLVEAARIMVRRKVRRLPVVSDGKLVGILTALDILSAVAAQSPRR